MSGGWGQPWGWLQRLRNALVSSNGNSTGGFGYVMVSCSMQKEKAEARRLVAERDGGHKYDPNFA
jgi:hypothetical protein